MSKSRTKLSLITLISGISLQLVTSIFNFITRTVFIKTLGENLLGLSALFNDILGMISLTELGIGMAMCYRFYRPVAEKDEKRVRVLINFYKKTYRVIGCVIFIFGLACIPLFPVLIKDYDNWEIAGINIIIVFLVNLMTKVLSYVLFEYRRVVFTADQKQYKIHLMEIFNAVLLNVAHILILVLTKNYMIYILANLCCHILYNVMIYIWSKVSYPSFFVKEKTSIDRLEFREMLKDCMATFVLKINNIVTNSTDSLIITAFIGLATVGRYSNYLVLTAAINKLMSMVFESYRPSLGSLLSTSKPKNSHFMFRMIFLLSVILGGTAAIGYTVVANEFVALWIGKNFTFPQPFPLLIGIGIFLYAIKFQLNQFREVTGIFKQVWFIPIISATVNITVSIALVQRIGINGVIIGTIVSNVLSSIVFEPYAVYKHCFKFYKPVSEYYLKLVSTIIMLVLAGAINQWICTNVLVGYGIWSLIVHALICLITVPIIVSIPYLKTEEFKYLVKKVLSVVK